MLYEKENKYGASNKWHSKQRKNPYEIKVSQIEYEIKLYKQIEIDCHMLLDI